MEFSWPCGTASRSPHRTMQTQLTAKKNDLKSGAFRDASMAMCALVAAADGTVDPSERQRVAQLIATNEVLQNFDADGPAAALRGQPQQADHRLRLRQGQRPAGDRQGEEEARRGARRHPDRHRHRRRRRRLRQGRAGRRPRGVLHARPAAARVRPLSNTRRMGRDGAQEPPPGTPAPSARPRSRPSPDAGQHRALGPLQEPIPPPGHRRAVDHRRRYRRGPRRHRHRRRPGSGGHRGLRLINGSSRSDSPPPV